MVENQEDQVLDDMETSEMLEEPSENDITNVLLNINSTMLTMGKSLKRLHEQQDKLHTSAESAKKAKLASHRQSESDTNKVSDSEELLDDGESDKTNTGEVQSEENDTLLDEIEHSLNEDEKTDNPVSEKLANIANKRWLQKLGDDQLKEKLEKYHRPENCEKLAVTQVNPEIWGKLDRFARAKDLKFSRLQEQVTKVGHIVLKSTEHLLKAKVDSSKLCPDDLVRMNTDALALLGHVCFEITQRRHKSIKPSLHKDYAMLCSSTVPVTSLLFGDDLQTELTHICATNKIGSTAGVSNPAMRNRNYQSSIPRQNQGRHFLGRAPQPYSRTPTYKYRGNQRRQFNQYNRETKRQDPQSRK